jgi:general secretion pathway protein F
MPRFTYKSVTPAGEVEKGEIDAPSRDAVIEQLRRQGHLPIRAEEESGGTTRSTGIRDRRSRTTGKDILLLTRELATLLSAGLPLDRALATLAGLGGTGALGSMADQVLGRVRSGASLADALEATGSAFPGYYVGMVRAGEAGGTLDQVLFRLADAMELAQATRETVRSALAYPILVLIMAGLSITVLMTAVIPEFRPLFDDAGATLPLSTRIVIGASDAVRDHGWIMVSAVVLAGVAFRRYIGRPAGRLSWDGALLRTPLVGDLVRKMEAARFCRTLGTLLANGVTLLNALSMVQETVTNRAIAAAVGTIRTHLRRGDGLGGPLRESAVFPQLAAQLIQVGEESGQLDTMLLRVADIYDEETRRTIQRMLALIVPAVTIVLGVVVAFIIGSMLSAILSAYELPQ